LSKTLPTAQDVYDALKAENKKLMASKVSGTSQKLVTDFFRKSGPEQPKKKIKTIGRKKEDEKTGMENILNDKRYAKDR